MSDKYQNKYRIPSARASWWDYKKDAAYFITICTKNRKLVFGQVMDKKMLLSQVGVIADILWYEIKNHTQNVILNDFIVMPNHIHGILILNNALHEEILNVETLHATSLPIQSIIPIEQQTTKPIDPQSTTKKNIVKNEIMSAISPKAGSLSTIIRSYKSAVTRHAHRLGFEFDWQLRFHDHIIRNQEEYDRIATYIKYNPTHWKEDKFFKE